MAQAQLVGKAVIVYGTVKAVSAAGFERILTPNSPIYANERIVTGPDGSVSVALINNPNPLILGRMSDVTVDEDVYGAIGQGHGEDSLAEVADIQALLQQNPDFDPTVDLPPPAAGPGGTGLAAKGGGRQIVIFTADQMEVTPDSGAETTGIGYTFLDPPPGGLPVADEGAEIPVAEPTVSMSDFAVREGDLAVFAVRVTGAAPGSTLALTFADGTAVSPADYASGAFEYSLDGGATWQIYTGAVALPPGDSVVQVRTTTVDDGIDEPNETFTLNAVLTSNSVTYSDSATATIIDNDVPTIIDNDLPTIKVGDITVDEGDPAVFGIQVKGAASGSALVLTFGDGTAVSPDDYASGVFEYSLDNGATWVSYSGAITLPAGDSVVQVRTTTVDDSIDEPNETFTLNAVLTSNSVTYSDSATATIIDNDVPTIKVGDITVDEGDPAVFGIQVKGAASGSALVLTFGDGTAVSPDDYASGVFEYSLDGVTWQVYAGAITLTAGDSVVQVRTTTVDDGIDEPNETFTLNAVLASNGVAYSDSATATIIDNDITDGNESVSTLEDTPLSGNVLDNSSTTHGSAKVVDFTIGSTTYIAGQAAIIDNVGELTIEEGGQYTFTPIKDYNGPVPQVTYTVSNGARTDTSTLDIAVTPVNDAPVAIDDTLVGREDEARTITASDLFGADGTGNENDYDVDSPTFTSITITGLGTNGRLQLNGEDVTLNQVILVADIDVGNLQFVPDKDFSGEATFKYTVSDGELSSNEATVTIGFSPVVDVPEVFVEIGKPYTVFTTIDNSTVLSPNLGFTVTAFNLDGELGDIAIRNSGVPTGFGVAGKASGDAAELGQSGGSSEKITVVFDTPVTQATLRFAWLAANEKAQYTLYDEEGKEIGGAVIQGITDRVDPALTLQGYKGALIKTIEFTAPTDGGDNDYLIHDISFVSSTVWSVNVTVAPTDVDYSESVLNVKLAVPEGAKLLAGTDNGDGTYTLWPISEEGGYSVSIDEETNEVFISGLQLEVPGSSNVPPSLVAITTIEDRTLEDETVTAQFIVGTYGDDTLVGTIGDDILIGKGGADTFKVGVGNDTITDYNKGEGDRVDISDIINGDLTRLDVADNNGRAQLVIYDEGNTTPIGSVTFDTIDFGEFEDGNQLNSLLDQIHLDHSK